MNSIWWQVAGWTMIHFLWIGTLVFLGVALLRLVLRRAAPQLRYAVSLVGFAVLAVAPVVIAWQLADEVEPVPTLLPVEAATVVQVDRYSMTPIETHERLPMPPVDAPPPDAIDLKFTPYEAPGAGDPVPTSPASPHVMSLPTTQGSARTARALDPVLMLQTLSDYLPWLWMIGTPVTLLLLVTGIMGSEQLRRRAKPVAEGPLLETLTRLRAALRIGCHVSLAVSDHVLQPVLVGFMRPLVLLPSVALTSWSPDEIEMALVHELAHVRRWDNLVNLVQRLVESLLFFHPAVWITSRWVRADREQCCDTVVVVHCGNRKAYASLLVSVAKSSINRRLPSPAMAMASHPLAKRVRRILQLEDDPMLVSKRTLLSIALVLMVLTAGAVWSSTLAEERKPSESEPASRVVPDPGDKEGTTVVMEGSEKPLTVDLDFAGTSRTYFFDADVPMGKINELIEKHGQAGHTVQIVQQNGDIQVIVTRAPHAPASPPASNPPFLSLEDQRIVDLVFKMVHAEITPATPEDLAAAKEKGFAGGVKIQIDHSDNSVGYAESAGLQPDDLLVGLHVWPTKDFDGLAEVLRRDDLGEFNPLKFYVLRKVEHEVPRAVGALPEKKMTTEYKLVTGRLVFHHEAWQAEQIRLAHEQAVSKVSLSVEERKAQRQRAREQDEELERQHRAADPIHQKANKPQLLYDGRTFDDWRTQWKTELKVENRTEAIKALRAFGRAGYGKEATEAILEVADEYPMTSIGGEFSPSSALQTAIAYSFVDINDSYPIPNDVVIPVLLQWYDASKDNRGRLAVWVLSLTKTKSDEVHQKLAALAKSKSADLRQAALLHLGNSDPKLEQEQTRSMLRAHLRDSDKWVRINALRMMTENATYYPNGHMSWGAHLRTWMPEMLPALFDRDLQVRQAARTTLATAQGPELKEFVQQLGKILKDPANSDQFQGVQLYDLSDSDQSLQRVQLETLRALAVLGRAAREVEGEIHPLLTSDDYELQVAASAALIYAYGGKYNPAMDSWGEMTDSKKDEIYESVGVMGKDSGEANGNFDSRNFSRWTNALKKEAEEHYFAPPMSGYFGGGGGGFGSGVDQGGGGMF